jgi:hypothetical protein
MSISPRQLGSALGHKLSHWGWCLMGPVLLLVLLIGVPALDQAGSGEPKVEPSQAIHGVSAKEFQAWVDRMHKEGYQPIDVSAYGTGDVPQFAAVAIKGAAHPWEARQGLTAAAYQKDFDAMSKKGYRLISVAGYRDQKATHFASIWLNDGFKPAWESRIGLTAAQYQKEFDAWVKRGFRPLQVVGYPEGNAVHYAAIFVADKATTWSSHNLSQAEYQKAFDEWPKKGYRPISICGFPAGKEARFAVVFIKDGAPGYSAAEHGLTPSQYQDEFNRWTQVGYRPDKVSGYAVQGAIHYAAVFVGLVPAGDRLTGKWGPLMSWPIVAVHTTLLDDGKVLIWPRGALSKPVGPKGEPAPTEAICYPRLWDPATHKFTTTPHPPYNIFCSSHTLLGDGRVFIAGGHKADTVGEPKACIYDPVKNKWTETEYMNAGRWYPSCLTLPNGDALVIAGDINSGKDNLVPQVFEYPTTAHWRSLTNAQGAVEDYPFLHVAPNGKVFLAGTLVQTKYLDTAGKGSWAVVGDRAYKQQRPYGSSVMYLPGHVLVLGGGDPPTATAEVIDLNDAKPHWKATDSMHFARRQQNATLLADGTVFVSGGTSAKGFNDGSKAVFHTEIWDPKTGHWRQMSPQSHRRLYHSTAILLPDGRVLSAGGGEPDGGAADRPIDIIPQDQFYNGHRNAQIYSPPYMFMGPQPVITSAPTTLAYGKTFVVKTPEAKNIHRVTLVRLSSTTHAQNFNQRFNELHFQPGKTAEAKPPLPELVVTAPPNHNVAPPGHYMLFILSDKGVPSVAKIVRLG